MSVTRLLIDWPAAGGGASEDSITNTWHFQTDGHSIVEADGIVGSLQLFYLGAGSRLSPLQDWANGRCRFYDMGETPPRAPWYERALGLVVTPNTSAMPTEMACVVSFQALQTSGIRQARRRGRIYVGPLASTAFSSTNGMLNPTFVTDMANAANTLHNSSVIASWDWLVVSTVAGLQFAPVAEGWVDNAPDVQRRRGRDATSRVFFPSGTAGRGFATTLPAPEEVQPAAS